MRNLNKPKSQSLKCQIDRKLDTLVRFGTSKKDARKLGDTVGIYAYKTMLDYRRAAQLIATRIKSEHPDCKGLEELEKYYPEYLKGRADKAVKGKISAYTVYLERASISKIYGRTGPSWGIPLPARTRGSITRSRNREGSATEKYLDKEKYADSLFISKALGNRRCEFTTLQKSKIVEEEIIEGWRIATAADVKSERIGEMFQGKLIVNVTGKGGKNRWIPCAGDVDEAELLKLLDARAGKNEKGYVFAKDAKGKLVDIPTKCDFHSRRREYAKKQYVEAAAWCEAHGKTTKYHMKGDKAGIVFNREALLIVSRILGHGRCDVVANYYLT